MGGAVGRGTAGARSSQTYKRIDLSHRTTTGRLRIHGGHHGLANRLRHVDGLVGRGRGGANHLRDCDEVREADPRGRPVARCRPTRRRLRVAGGLQGAARTCVVLRRPEAGGLGAPPWEPGKSLVVRGTNKKRDGVGMGASTSGKLRDGECCGRPSRSTPFEWVIDIVHHPHGRQELPGRGGGPPSAPRRGIRMLNARLYPARHRLRSNNSQNKKLFSAIGAFHGKKWTLRK